MGGVLDFITQGQAPVNVTSTGTSSTNLPGYLNDYAQQLLSQANAVAGEGYIPYQGPRVAPFNSTQQQAFSLAQGNVGDWKPMLGQSASLIGSATAPGTGGLSAAQPYLSGAMGRFNDPSTVSSYMNPYTQNVIDASTRQAMENYTQQIKPMLDNQFIAAGQYGSSAHEREADRAANQLTQDIQGNALGALSQAYNTAGSLFGADQSRMTQLGSIAGSLGSSDRNSLLSGAGQLGALGQLYSSLGSGDVSTLANIGALQQGQTQKNLDTAYSDFLAQRDYPKTQLGWLQSLLAGTPHGTTTTDSKTGPLPGAGYGPSPGSGLLSTAANATGLYQKLFPNGIGDSAVGGWLGLGTPTVDYNPANYQISPSDLPTVEPIQFSDEDLGIGGYRRGGLALAFEGA